MKNRHMQLRTTVLPIAALLLALTIVPAQALAQSDQDVDAYNKNQFLQALEKFQQISGPHTQEAQQYTGKMKSYQEAMQLAKGIMDRSPDERDATSLEYAIQQFQRAIQIKPDGPWQPADQLAKARDLKAQVEKAHA